MAINDEIAAGGRPIQFENPLNNMVKMFNIRNDMQTNQMNQMKMDEARRAQAGAEATRGFFRQPGLDIENMTPAQDRELAGLNYDVYEKLKTQQGKQRDERSQADKRSAETEALHILPYAAEYGKLNNRDEAVRLTTHMYANKNLANAPFRAKTLEQAIAAIPDDTTPEGQIAFKDYASKNALGAKDYADKQLLSFAVEGGDYVGRNKFTGAIVSRSPMSMTAEQQTKFPVGFQEGTTSLDARRVSLQAKLAEINNPNTTPERARALENDIAQDRRSISAQQQDQESMRTGALEAAKPRQEFENLLRDRAALVAKLGAAAKNDPEVKGMTARINYLTTHPGQEPVDPRKVANTVPGESGSIDQFNIYGQKIGHYEGVAKPSAQFIKTREQTKTLGKNLDLAIAELENATKDGGLIDQSTGSGLGKLANTARGFITGGASKGAIAGAKLAPIADLGLKMVPRFEGPQSDKDTQSYKEASGQLADTSIPNEIRKDAGKTVLRLLKARKGQFVTPEMAAQGEAPQGSPPPPAGFVLN